MTAETPYRIGSPFAEPDALLAAGGGAALLRRPMGEPFVPVKADAYYHLATAACWSAALLVAFATACWVWFPGGGVPVAALGGAMSLLALMSHRPWLACGLALIHSLFFFGCILRVI